MLVLDLVSDSVRIYWRQLSRAVSYPVGVLFIAGNAESHILYEAAATPTQAPS